MTNHLPPPCAMPCLLWFLLLLWQSAAAQTTIGAHDPHIAYMGRIVYQSDTAELSWPGSSATIRFRGTGAKAWLKDEQGNNFYKVIVDGTPQPDLQMDTARRWYTLAQNLPAGEHELTLYKRTEWTFGKTCLYGFALDSNSTLAEAPPAKQRNIEFYGNSITCGYGVLDTTGQDRGTAPFEDNYISYAAITARHFNAAFHCIARSGIGVTVSWFPLIMPEMYDRKDPTDSASKWDFSSYTPDVVVVNLFQNDSWLIKQPQHPEFVNRFGSKPPAEDSIVSAYRAFIKQIRAHYPKAYIICALGNMDATQQGSPWPQYISKTVNALHDKRITSHFFPYKNTPGHPSASEQQAMADDLIRYIEEQVTW